MSAPSTIDIETLLAPVSDEAPAGVDPRASDSANSLYYQVKDARNAARSEERAMVEVDGAATPEEWNTVVSAAGELLTREGKDFEVASWLVEALVRTDGLAGLRDGLKVITGIAENYWEGSFPELDEDGIEGKLVAVAGLSGAGAPGTLAQPLRLLPLTHGTLASYSLWSYEQASELQKIADEERRLARIDAGAVNMEQFMQSVAETPASEFALAVSLVEECGQELARMSTAFDAVAGSEAPPISGLRDLIEQIGSSIRYFAADKLASVASELPPDDAMEETSAAEAEGDDDAAPTPVSRVGGYSSRDEALADLMRLAVYFRKTEPHSPISYTLEEAVRRARMPLPELLAELADDPAYVQHMLLAAGIRNLKPSDNPGDQNVESTE